MNPKATKLIAKIIAIVLCMVLVITSFTFVFYWGAGANVVYAGEADSTVASSTAIVSVTPLQELIQLDMDMEYLQELILEIKENYKDDISYEDLVNGAYSGVIESLDDPYSVYYATADEGESFVESVDGEFSGVGVSLEDYNGQCRVVAPIAGTPAEKAGIKSGDIIIKVDGADVSGETVDEVAAKIRGEVGTKVTLTVMREGKTLSFTMVRAKIKTTSVEYELLEGNIGYISISQFDNDSDNEFAAAKAALIKQGADSFIVDVRNNPGGYVAVAANIAEQFMEAGPITHFVQRGETVETISADGSGTTEYPVVLLVNGSSASASEILAGAWQDTDAATLVGTSTFGKGVAQQVFKLANGASIKLSMYYFVTPNWKTIDKVGITPDYYVTNYDTTELESLQAEYETFAPMSEKEKPAAGSTGLNVYGAQQRLQLLGYKVTVSGTMDAATVAAVKTFQAQHGFAAYGVLDYATMNALDADTINYVTGNSMSEDLQLDKAVDLLN